MQDFDDGILTHSELRQELRELEPGLRGTRVEKPMLDLVASMTFTLDRSQIGPPVIDVSDICVGR